MTTLHARAARSAAETPNEKRHRDGTATFTYAYYHRMLAAAREQGYVVSSFADFDARHDRTIILRHDVDYTLDGIDRFAAIEHALGITATYLFRVHADEYNLFAPTTWARVRAIRELGHEIGLHFEAMNVGRALGLHPPDLLASEKAAIEAILGHPVRTASEHRELSGMLHDTPRYHEVFDSGEAGFEFFAMDDRFTRAMKYLSDSNANWREGDLLEHLGRHDRFQVLVHPDWWFETDLLLKGPYHHPRGTDE